MFWLCNDRSLKLGRVRIITKFTYFIIHSSFYDMSKKCQSYLVLRVGFLCPLTDTSLPSATGLGTVGLFSVLEGQASVKLQVARVVELTWVYADAMIRVGSEKSLII